MDSVEAAGFGGADYDATTALDALRFVHTLGRCGVDGARRATLDAVCATAAFVSVKTHRVEICIHSNSFQSDYFTNTLSLIVVPFPTSVSIIISSVYFFMLGRPIPAPKPN